MLIKENNENSNGIIIINGNKSNINDKFCTICHRTQNITSFAQENVIGGTKCMLSLSS